MLNSFFAWRHVELPPEKFPTDDVNWQKSIERSWLAVTCEGFFHAKQQPIRETRWISVQWRHHYGISSYARQESKTWLWCLVSLASIDLLSFECREQFAFALVLPCYAKQLDQITHSTVSSRKVKPKAIVTRSHTFSRALLRLHVIQVLIGSLDYLCPSWLAKVISLLLVLRHSVENCSIA